ncbi:MAG: ProP effector [Idiomarinaceae bacterium HL-53]|nr:MAG: ProP effector [Idiomarinaceae bacterium HL-53]CUS49019.1 ProP effector [Idiomarinaceae bacterium HL-53]
MTNKETENSQDETSTKLPNSKAVIAYLADKFPLCFTLKGDVKPLKIGIFDDLAARLADDDKVSKTRIRVALRQYTNSWRYLRSVKEGVDRVGLDGETAGKVEADHEQHAVETLTASKAKVDEKRKATAPKPASKKKATSLQRKVVKKQSAAAKPKPHKAVETEQVRDTQQLSIGQKVQVKFGQSLIFATVSTIDKNEAQVQLDSGMTLKVATSDLFEIK